MLKKYSDTFAKILGLLLLSGAFSNCTFKSPGTETPPPDPQRIEKSFFVDPSGKPKTFLCGWAPEEEIGYMAQATQIHNAPEGSEHCNIQFQITETDLLGKAINPSYPNDPTRWETVLKIPIVSHFYYERDKDANGRESNKIIENSSRSHWSSRPYMKLNFSGLSILKWNFALLQSEEGESRTSINSVEDIEWDAKNNFLGFTVQASGSDSTNQARFRVNFLKFDHDETFKKTPFNDKNYKYMDIIHVVGEKVDGLYPILYAAHWDLRKSHTIYLNNFPEEYISLGDQVVNEWNETLVKAGAIAQASDGFKVSHEKLKHGFDLRYPSITWVSDLKISSYSPLGIGLAYSDVKNGEILWAGITLYGGFIESYIKSHSSVGGNGESQKLGFDIADRIFNKKLAPTLNVPDHVGELATINPDDFVKKLAPQLATSSQQISESQAQDRLKKDKDVSRMNEEQKNQALTKFRGDLPSLTVSQAQQIVKTAFEVTKDRARSAMAAFSNKSYRDLLIDTVFPGHSNRPQEDGQASKKSRPANVKETFLTEKTFADVGPGWIAEIQTNGLNYQDVVNGVVKYLIAHEYGHILGLGHQFEENILPEEGTVPDSIYRDLKARATKERFFTNYSSVMGYPHPRTEVHYKPEDIKPGPHDRLVLAYLYTQRYSTFKKGDQDFTFVPMPENGIIPAVNPKDPGGRKTSYFPQCNDGDVWVSTDPYCNRFDAGSNPQDIVDNYIRDLKDNLINTVIAFTDSKGGNSENAEMYLWGNSLRSMGRIRLFYDYMREKYKKEINYIRNDEKALFDFSNACTTGQTDNEKLKEIFKKTELKDLCIVNARAVDEIAKLVSLDVSDYTKKNPLEYYFPNGERAGDTSRDYGHVFGTWSQLSGIALKISALYALTTPIPWSGWLNPIYSYTTPDQRYAYSSLYPIEYTKAFSAVIKNNLRFSNLGFDETTSMGQAVLSLGYFNYLAHLNNDGHRFPEQYIKRIYSQTQFDLHIGAIVIKGEQKEGANANIVDRFNGSVYDFNATRDIARKLTEVYLLPDGDVMARAENMFLYPLNKLIVFDDKQGYVISYIMDYVREGENDVLSNYNIKNELKAAHDNVIYSCTKGQNGQLNGLMSFFNKTEPEFKGFVMSPKLVTDDIDARNQFLRSINENFELYYGAKKFADRGAPPVRGACFEALRGLSLIISSAAVANGYWLPEAEYNVLH